jgi:hypothetical protein
MLDTAEVLRAEMGLSHRYEITDAQREAHIAFRRVWASPTQEERQAVIVWAEKIAAFSHRRPRSSSFTWNGLAG